MMTSDSPEARSTVINRGAETVLSADTRNIVHICDDEHESKEEREVVPREVKEYLIDQNIWLRVFFSIWPLSLYGHSVS